MNKYLQMITVDFLALLSYAVFHAYIFAFRCFIFCILKFVGTVYYIACLQFPLGVSITVSSLIQGHHLCEAGHIFGFGLELQL